MRPISLLSAALCGVLWTSSNLIVGIAAQRELILSCENQYSVPSCVSLCTQSPSAATILNCTPNPVSTFPIIAPATTMPTAILSSPTDINLGAGNNILTDGDFATITTVYTAVGLEGPTVLTSVATLPLERTTITSHLMGGETTYVITVTPTISVTGAILSTPSVTSSGTTVPTRALESAVPASDNGSSSGTKKSNIGAIVGGIVGGVVVIALIGFGAFLLWRRRRNPSTPRDAFNGLEKNRESSSPSVYPSPPPHAISYDAPVSAPPQSVTPGEAHALMSGYPEPQPSGEVVPVVGAQKPYVVGATETEVDDDGVSLRSPSPPLPDAAIERGRDFVPRLPIYNRGSDETPRGPAL